MTFSEQTFPELDLNRSALRKVKLAKVVKLVSIEKKLATLVNSKGN